MSNANATVLQNGLQNVLTAAQAANGNLAVIEASVKKEAIQAIETIVSAANPLAGMFAGLVVPLIVNNLVDAIFALIANAESAIPTFLAKIETSVGIAPAASVKAG